MGLSWPIFGLSWAILGPSWTILDHQIQGSKNDSTQEGPSLYKNIQEMGVWICTLSDLDASCGSLKGRAWSSKSAPFSGSFWSRLQPCNGARNSSQSCPKSGKICAHFRVPFFQAFGALQVHLGSLLGPFEAVLDGLGTSKTFKNLRSLMFL